MLEQRTVCFGCLNTCTKYIPFITYTHASSHLLAPELGIPLPDKYSPVLLQRNAAQPVRDSTIPLTTYTETYFNELSIDES